MQLENVGELFIRRVLQLNKTDKVTIEIGKPEKFPDGEDYYCPYRIIGLGNEEIQRCGGIDGIQALLLTLERIGGELVDSNEYREGKLSWVGSENGNLGFPHSDSSGLLAHFT